MAPRLDDPATWPGAVLAVVRPDGSLLPERGLLVGGVGPVVHLVPPAEATPRALRFCDRLRYPGWAELAADGWRPD